MTLVAEQIRTFTPLGLRFWDPARDLQIGDGLDVSIVPESMPTKARIQAFRTGSGIYAFQGLPGLRRVENGEPLAEGAVEESFVVTVVDRRNRFLPALFRVDLPLPYGGLFRPAGPAGSPPEDGSDTRFYLFSAPTRTPAPGMAVLRVQLQERDSASAAAFALVEVLSGAERWYGLSAQNGSTVVIFPYPTFAKSLGDESPLRLAGEQQWPLTVRIFYEPARQSRRSGQPAPDLATIREQGQATLFPQADGPASDEIVTQLQFEEETRLVSANLSHLLIEPPLSSP